MVERVSNVIMGLTGPVIVETKESETPPMDIIVGEPDSAEARVDPDPELGEPRMIELVSPNGEQPTNDGAVSLTVAHSWMLNKMASERSSDLLMTSGDLVHIRCWSEVSQLVARQHESVLTYSAFAQRHLMSRPEQLPADAVELLRQVCCTC